MKKNIVKVSEIATSPSKLWDEDKMLKKEIKSRMMYNSGKTKAELKKEILADEGWWQLKYQESLPF